MEIIIKLEAFSTDVNYYFQQFNLIPNGLTLL